MSAIAPFLPRPRTALALLFLMAAPAWAGLGAMHLRSAQGAPFVAEIEVTDAKPGESLQASLPGPALQRELALGWSPYYGSIKVEVKTRDDGSSYVRLSQSRPFREPFLELAVALEQNGSRSVRAFSAPMPTAVGKEGATIRGTDVELPAAPAAARTPIPAVIAAPEPDTPAAAAPREDTKTFLARLKEIEDAEAGLAPAKKPAPKPAVAKPAGVKAPEAKQEETGKGHGFPWLIAGGSLGGVLVLAAAGFWLWRRRRARRGEAEAVPVAPVMTAAPPDDVDLTAALEPIAETKLPLPATVGEEAAETDDALWGDESPAQPAEPAPTQGSVDDVEIDAWFSETAPEPSPEPEPTAEPTMVMAEPDMAMDEPATGAADETESPAADADAVPLPSESRAEEAVTQIAEPAVESGSLDEMFDMLSVEDPVPPAPAPEPEPVPETAPEPVPDPAPAAPGPEDEQLLEFDFQIEHEPAAETAAPAPAPVGVPGMALDDMALDLDSVDPGNDDPVTAKLDLARVYLDMGDYEGVREILEEVLKEGSASQQEEARAMLAAVTV